MRLNEDICKVKGCNNHVMEGRFGLESFRYGYCQIHKIEGTWEETTPKTSTMNNQRKKDDEALHVSHPCKQTSKEEDKTMKCKTGDVCTHVDTDALTNPTLDVVSRTDGRRLNSQDCSGSATGTAKEDTNESVLPADSKFTYKCICDWSKDDKYGFIPNTGCPVHGKQTKKMLSKGVPILIVNTNNGKSKM